MNQFYPLAPFEEPRATTKTGKPRKSVNLGSVDGIEIECNTLCVKLAKHSQHCVMQVAKNHIHLQKTRKRLLEKLEEKKAQMHLNK